MNSDGNCSPVNTTVANCKYYSSQNICSHCQSGFVLNQSGSECSAFGSTSNCANFAQKDPFCVRCDAGFTLSENNECTASDNVTSEKKCLYYDPNDDTKCTMCNTGFYMNKDGVCGEFNGVPAGLAAEVSSSFELIMISQMFVVFLMTLLFWF